MSQFNFKQPGRRRGFTLIELLVVIVVIGILIGILIPVLGPMVNRAKTAAVQAEIQQMESAIEEFKTKYGFYPPDFSTINNGSDMMPYLRTISQNHEHTLAQVNTWWTDVGQHIKHYQGAEIVFWLSGLRKSAQFPLYDPTSGGPIAAYAVGLEDREIFYDFEQKRLEFDGDSVDMVARYIQPKFEVQPFVYFNSNTYASSSAVVRPYLETDTAFFNPRTFQVVAAGKDETFGTIPGDQVTATVVDWYGDKEHYDNVCNFAEGELKKVVGF